MSNSEKVVVSVSKHGPATIPKRFREKLGISAPGRVTFREREDGSVVVEPVSTPEEMRGFFKCHGEALTDNLHHNCSAKTANGTNGSAKSTFFRGSMTVPERVVFDAEPIVAHADDEFGSANVEEYLNTVADGETEGMSVGSIWSKYATSSFGSTTGNGLTPISSG